MAVAIVDAVAVEELPAGIRPHAAYADAAAIAEENAELCASRRRFLAAVSAAG